MAYCVSSCVTTVIGSSGSMGASAPANSGAIMSQNTASTSQTDRAANAEVAGERIKVEKAIASASQTPA